jgi:hypothetical protein
VSAVWRISTILVLVLLCVPSLTRVYQRLDYRSTASTLTSSFTKSVDCPPTKILIDMPRATASRELLVEPTPALEEVSLVADGMPVPSADTAPPDALRAPPRL